MNAYVRKEQLKALVRQAIISVLEEDVYGAPAEDSAWQEPSVRACFPGSATVRRPADRADLCRLLD